MNYKSIALFLMSSFILGTCIAEDIYRADPEHTFVSFSYKHLNYSVQTSRFDSTNGTIRINDGHNNGVIDMTIDTKSISTGSTSFNKLLQSDSFFATDKFPVAIFKSDRIIFNHDEISSIDGELTIKGITKPISIAVNGFACSRNFLTLKYTCGANASAQLNRSDFDLGKYAPFVGDEVTLNIVIEASRD